MELTLGIQFNVHQRAAIAGAFIHGHSPEVWLREINSWGIPMQHLTALLVPENKQSNIAAGLFVFLQQATIPDSSDIVHPYQLVGDKLFIPTTACPTPAINSAGLSRLLIWDWQIYHPTLGFIGFEQKEVIPLSDLLSFTLARESDWEFARLGLPARVQLHRIGIATTDTDIFSYVSTIIGNRSLLPADHAAAPDTTTISAPDEVPFFSKMLQQLAGFFGLGKGSAQEKGHDDIEGKRKQALDKLLALFDQDEEAALQYAIPIGSPYEQRGISPQKGTALTRNHPTFSLQGLGGGQLADFWDTSDYNTHLQKKYTQAAKAAIAAGAFEKAAYIYAHLLGDYSSAANVLEQGGYYREAAIMHKKHLNNPGAAAACLEKGGLLLEAIDIYVEGHQYEKAADLYMAIDQPAAAIPLYHKAIQVAIDNYDMLSASSITREKLQEVEKAREYLLDGWKHNIQPTDCLQQYLALAGERLTQELHHIYKNHVPSAQDNRFLQVLTHTHSKYDQEDVKAMATDIAYEIISKQSLNGNLENMKLLKRFVSDDRLLQGDCIRFINSRHRSVITQKKEVSFRFAADVKWLTGTVLDGQLILIGCKPNGIYLLRFNGMNHWEYTLWPGSIPITPHFTLVSDIRYSNRILIHSNLPFEMGYKVLESKSGKAGFENELIAGDARWLPKNLIGYCFTKEDTVTLHINDGRLVLSFYSNKGELKDSQRCTSGGETFLVIPDFRQEVQEIIYWYGNFYIFLKDYIYKIDHHARVQPLLAADTIRHLSAAYDRDMLGMAAVTDSGIIWATYTYGGEDPILQLVSPDSPMGTKVKYLPPHFLLTYNNNNATVFRLMDGKAGYSHTIVTGSAICAVLTLPQLHHVAIMEENGDMRIFDLADHPSAQ